MEESHTPDFTSRHHKMAWITNKRKNHDDDHIAELLGINKQSMHNWIHRYRKDFPSAYHVSDTSDTDHNIYTQFQGTMTDSGNTIPVNYSLWQPAPAPAPTPTFNDIYQFIKNNPDHVYYDYFMKKVGSRNVEQIINDQGKLEKFLAIINDYIKIQKGQL